MNAEEVASLLERPKKHRWGWTARCPAHDDRTASLTIRDGDEGVMLHCHAGCENERIRDCMGLPWKALFYEERTNGGTDATYQYHDENGELVYTVLRKPGKQFPAQRASDGAWTLEGVQRYPYRLPELLEAVGKRKVFVCEGEKDVDAIVKAGGVATCNPGGAGKWRDEFAPYFTGAHVIIVADKDEAGRAHAEQVRANLEPVAASVRVVQAREGKDAYDHLKKYGLGDFDDVVAETGMIARRLSGIEPRDVDWLEGFENMVAFGALTTIMGMPGTNKSTLACAIAARVLRRGGTAAFLGDEDGFDMLRPRLEAAGADVDRCFGLEKLDDEGYELGIRVPSDLKELEAVIKKEDVRLVVVDPIAAHLDVDIDSHKDQSVRDAVTPLARLAIRHKISVVSIVHTNKVRSTSPMLRAGGSIGIPGVSRTCLVMAYHPDYPPDSDMRAVAGFKNNWGPIPETRVYRIEACTVPGTANGSIRLVEWGTTWHKAHHLLRERGLREEENE